MTYPYDHRSRERRLLDAIFNRSPEYIEAYNEGFIYATNGEEPGSAKYDYVQEDDSPGDAFWQGCDDGNKRLEAFFDATFGKEIEAHLSDRRAGE